MLFQIIPWSPVHGALPSTATELCSLWRVAEKTAGVKGAKPLASLCILSFRKKVTAPDKKDRFCACAKWPFFEGPRAFSEIPLLVMVFFTAIERQTACSIHFNPKGQRPFVDRWLPTASNSPRRPGPLFFLEKKAQKTTTLLGGRSL